MRLSILPLLFACAACGVNADETIDIAYDACAPLALLAADDASEDERTSVRDAAAMWNAHGRTQLFMFGDDGVPADVPVVPIRFERAAIAFLGIYEDEVGEIIVNRELHDPGERAIVIAHEVGHAFGLQHVERGRSVMNQGNLTIAPTAEDQAALIVRSASCSELEADAR